MAYQLSMVSARLVANGNKFENTTQTTGEKRLIGQLQNRFFCVCCLVQDHVISHVSKAITAYVDVFYDDAYQRAQNVPLHVCNSHRRRLDMNICL